MSCIGPFCSASWIFVQTPKIQFTNKFLNISTIVQVPGRTSNPRFVSSQVQTSDPPVVQDICSILSAHHTDSTPLKNQTSKKKRELKQDHFLSHYQASKQKSIRLEGKQ